MSPGVHFGSGEGSAERLRGFVAGVRFLSFSRSIRSIFRTSAGRSICGGTWYFASGEGSTEGLGGPGARFVNFSRLSGRVSGSPPEIAGEGSDKARLSLSLALSLSLPPCLFSLQDCDRSSRSARGVRSARSVFSSHGGCIYVCCFLLGRSPWVTPFCCKCNQPLSYTVRLAQSAECKALNLRFEGLTLPRGIRFSCGPSPAQRRVLLFLLYLWSLQDRDRSSTCLLLHTSLSVKFPVSGEKVPQKVSEGRRSAF